MVRLSSAWRRYSAWKIASGAIVALVVVGIGFGGSLKWWREESWYALTFGVMFFLMGALLLATLPALVVQNRFPRGLPTVRNVDLDGKPAMFVPRWTFPVWQACAFATVMGLGALGWVVLAVADDRYGLVAFAAVAAAWLLSLPAFVAAGRFTAGGLWLTPTRVVHRLYGVRAEVNWDDVWRLDTGRYVVLLWSEHSRQGYRTPWWRGKKMVRDNRVVVDGDFLALSPAETILLLDHYLRSPDDRAELGTDAALRRLDAVRARVGTYAP